MSMAISQMGVYRALNGHFDGHSKAQPSIVPRAIEQGARTTIEPFSEPQGLAREINRAENLNTDQGLYENVQHATHGDSTQLHQRSVDGGLDSSIDLAKFFLNLDSGTAPGPTPMRAQMAEENYLKAMGMF